MENNQREPERSRRETGHREEQTARQSTGRNGRGVGRTIGSVFGTLVLIFVLTCVFFAGIFTVYINTTLTKEASLDMDVFINDSLSTFLYYENKETGGFEELQMLNNGENRIEVEFYKIPKNLQNACIAIEDERFISHHGVDWKRTAGAVVNMFIGMKNTYGGSTITQQLIKNMTGDNDGTVKRKVTEIFRALDLEKKLSKDEILEKYLNNIYLGNASYGVQAGAQTYFNKDVSDLTLAECASLIGITNNPWVYDPMRNEKSFANNQSRKELVLGKMLELEMITQSEYGAAMAEKVAFVTDVTAPEPEEGSGRQVTSYFVDQVINDVAADLAVKLGISTKAARSQVYYRGYRIYTTVDPAIQAIAESVYENRDNLNYTSRKGQKLQSAITVVDPFTGNVVAMVGGIGVKEKDAVLNRAVSLRQCGSSIKPIASYAPALDAGIITMASTFDNSPVRLLNDSPWPKNSGGAYTGMTTLSRGVAGSINTVAVRVNEMLGNQASYDFMTEKLGFTTLVNDDINTAALGLGGLTNGVNTEEVAAAFAAFANQGMYNRPHTYTKVTDAEGNVILENGLEATVAMKETTAYFINQLLQGAVSNGTGGGAQFSGMSIAGKTGTTNDNYDRYFAGYTPYYSAAVWCGYDKNEKIVASINPAAALWRKVMSEIHKELPDKKFDKPGGLTSLSVCMDSGMRATDACANDVRGSRIQSVSVASGTEPTGGCTMHKEVSYCNDGKCLSGEFCPAESVKTVSVLDYVRDSFGVEVGDTPYLFTTMEAAVAETGCPIHTTAVEVPPEEGWGDDPMIDDPNGGLPPEGGVTEPGEVGGGPGTGSTGGGGDDGWGGLAPPPTEPTEPVV